MMDKEIKCRLALIIKESIGNGVKEGELFEEFNKILRKYSLKPKNKRIRKKLICRPALMISDSSCDDR